MVGVVCEWLMDVREDVREDDVLLYLFETWLAVDVGSACVGTCLVSTVSEACVGSRVGRDFGTGNEFS